MPVLNPEGDFYPESTKPHLPKESSICENSIYDFIMYEICNSNVCYKIYNINYVSQLIQVISGFTPHISFVAVKQNITVDGDYMTEKNRGL